MALTRVNGSRVLLDASVSTVKIANDAITTAKVNDDAITTAKILNDNVTTAKIADDAVDADKLDDSASYVIAGLTVDSDVAGDNNKVVISGAGAITSQGGDLNVQNVAGDTSYLSVNASTGAVNINQDLTVGTNVTVTGDLTVNGTTTTVNSTVLDVVDKNITVAQGSADKSVNEGAGLTVDNGSDTDGSFIYKDTSATKFAIGLAGAEVNVVDVSTTQTLTNKVVDLTGASVVTLGAGVTIGTNASTTDLETLLGYIASAANAGLTLTIDTDTSVGEGYYTFATQVFDMGVTNLDKVKVYVGGLKMKEGAGNDYTVVLSTGIITFLDDISVGGTVVENVTIEFVAA
jgi:hypothetical protein